MWNHFIENITDASISAVNKIPVEKHQPIIVQNKGIVKKRLEKNVGSSLRWDQGINSDFLPGNQQLLVELWKLSNKAGLGNGTKNVQPKLHSRIMI